MNGKPRVEITELLLRYLLDLAWFITVRHSRLLLVDAKVTCRSVDQYAGSSTLCQYFEILLHHVRYTIS